MQCIGTPQHIKNNFGTGYLITLVIQEDKIDEVMVLSQKIMPNAKFKEYMCGHLFLHLE